MKTVRAKTKPQPDHASIERLRSVVPMQFNAATKIENPAVNPNNLLVTVMTAIVDPQCDPAKMQALLDVRERLMKEEAHVQFISAYIDLRADLPSINKDGKIVAEGISKKSGRAYSQTTPYATFENINRITAPILARHRFALLLLPDVGKDGIGILMRGQLAFVCETPYGRIVHAEHCAIAAPLETGGSKNNVQGIGSSISYAKRYASVTLMNLVSHAPEDRDIDGNDPKAVEKAQAAVPKIDAKQIKQLTAAIDDCGVGAEMFCKKYEIDAIADLPPKLFSEAISSCKRFKATKEAKRKEEAAMESARAAHAKVHGHSK